MKWLKAFAWAIAMGPFAWGGIELIRVADSFSDWRLLVGLFCLNISSTIWDKAWAAMGFGEQR